MTGTLHGHAEARRVVLAALARGSLPHALLVTGESGIGKRRFAEWVVQAAWCREAERPCGRCASCRKIASGNHPDLHVVARDPRDEHGSRHEITVNQIRHGLIAALGVRPLEAPGHAVIIDEADELNEEAQNALLKTLEEPPRGSLLLLTTAREDVLLDTIRSRCQTLRLAPLSEEEVAAVCATASLAVDPGAVRLARGRPGRLAELARLDTTALLSAFDDVLCGRSTATAFARTCAAVASSALGTREEDDDDDSGGAARGPPDEPRVRRAMLDLLRTRLRDLVLLRSEPAARGLVLTLPPAGPEPPGAEGLPAADALLLAEPVLLEAAEDIRRHLPAQVAWTALGAGLSAVAMGVRTGPEPKT